MPKCSVENCTNDAYFEVFLYDVYIQGESDTFFESDETCPYLCKNHMVENENSIQGTREPRRVYSYKHSNRYSAQGFTIYKPLE